MSADLSYNQLAAELLQAIRDGNEDLEMVLRADLENYFRLSEEQVNSRLFRLLSQETIHPVQSSQESVDLAHVE